MKKYKYECHCHTTLMSPCGKTDPAVTVREYIKAGYDGIYITDHLFAQNPLNKYSELSWKEVVDNHFKGFNAVSDATDGKIDIFCGAELRIADSVNDYLIYGVNKTFFYEHDLISMTLAQVSEAVRKNGGLLVQAHPFRSGMKIADPKLLDGIETYNGNFRHDSRNDIAKIWADKHDLIKLSGSDFHQIEDLARGGIMTNHKIESEKDFAITIKSGNYSIIETFGE